MRPKDTEAIRQRIQLKLQGRHYQTHPFETHPLTALYQVLWEGTVNWCLLHRISRPGEVSPGFMLRQIPDTLVWESNIPKGWYRYEEELVEGKWAGNIRKDKVDTKKVDTVFGQGKHNDAICCTYISRALDNGKEYTKIEYLTRAALRIFLFSRNRGKGSCIIQKWVQPQNGCYNDTIQAVWTHGLKCFVERRRNRHYLHDTSIPLQQRAVTFDGPPHFSTDVIVSSKLREQVERSCNSIAEHFNKNTAQGQRQTVRFNLARMVAHFKIDSKCRLVLLGVVGARVYEVGKRYEVYVALDLAPVYKHVVENQEEDDQGLVVSSQRRHTFTDEGEDSFEAPEEYDADDADLLAWLSAPKKTRRRSSTPSVPQATVRRVSTKSPHHEIWSDKSSNFQDEFGDAPSTTNWGGKNYTWGKHNGGVVVRNGNTKLRDAEHTKTKKTRRRPLAASQPDQKITKQLLKQEREIDGHQNFAPRAMSRLVKMLHEAKHPLSPRTTQAVRVEYLRSLPNMSVVEKLEYILLKLHGTGGNNDEKDIHSTRISPRGHRAAKSHSHVRWALLSRAVRSGYIRVQAAIDILKVEISDMVYGYGSHLLGIAPKMYSFTLGTTDSVSLLFLSKFLTAINATEGPTGTYSISPKTTPLYICDAAHRSFTKHTCRLLNTMLKAVLSSKETAIRVIHGMTTLGMSSELLSSSALHYGESLTESEAERNTRKEDDGVEEATSIDGIAPVFESEEQQEEGQDEQDEKGEQETVVEEGEGNKEEKQEAVASSSSSSSSYTYDSDEEVGITFQ